MWNVHDAHTDGVFVIHWSEIPTGFFLEGLFVSWGGEPHLLALRRLLDREGQVSATGIIRGPIGEIFLFMTAETLESLPWPHELHCLHELEVSVCLRDNSLSMQDIFQIFSMGTNNYIVSFILAFMHCNSLNCIAVFGLSQVQQGWPAPSKKKKPMGKSNCKIFGRDKDLDEAWDCTWAINP